MPQMIFQPGPTEGEDVHIHSLTPSANYGSVVQLNVGCVTGRTPTHQRSLLRFDLSSIPAGVVVISASLELYNDGFSSDSHTAYAYRCPVAWTELGATWNTYDGANAWPVNFVGGDWDASIVASDTVGVGEDAEFNVLSHVQDAVANRGGELNLLLRTAEVETDYRGYYSSDEAVKTAKRPKLVVEYILTGSRIYLGAGGVEDIDWDTPIAFVPEGTTETGLPLSLTPARRYALAVRRVSPAGVEEHNTHVMTFLETDDEGLLQPAPLPRPFDLSFERVSADTIRLGFSCDVPLGHAEPTEYRVHGDGGTGVMDYETPIAALSEHIAGRREFVIELPVSTLPLQLAARAWRDAQAGPISPVLVVPSSPPPVAPAILPET